MTGTQNRLFLNESSQKSFCSGLIIQQAEDFSIEYYSDRSSFQNFTVCGTSKAGVRKKLSHL